MQNLRSEYRNPRPRRTSRNREPQLEGETKVGRLASGTQARGGKLPKPSRACSWPQPFWGIPQLSIHPYATAMDSRDLTLAQLDALFAKLAPMAHYLRKLENRMHHECFPADDELFKLVEPASGDPRALCSVREGQAEGELIKLDDRRNPNSESR